MNNTNYYINGIGILSPQKTFDNKEFLAEIIAYHENVLTCIAPDFKAYINPIQLRRLSRMLRVGLTAAMICTKDCGDVKPDGIITGTGYGFLTDTARFVSEMLGQEEKHLTPTFFMQGTYNALSGLVALTLKCNGYNNTYVNKGFSFETSLHDAIMQLNENSAINLLVGAYDEAGEVQYKVNSRVKHYKSEHINSLELFQHPTRGSIQGEGAAFFAVGKERMEGSWAALKAVKMIYKPGSVQLLSAELNNFLAKNSLSLSDIDLFLSGLSGDVENDKLLSALTTSMFQEIPEIRFKHLCGEYCTASAFGLWLAASILKRQKVPPEVIFNRVTIASPIKTALLVNQYMGKNYSFILLQAV